MLFNSILAAPLFQANQNTRQQTAKRLDKHNAWGVLIFHKLYFQNLLCSEPFLEAGLNSDDVQFSWDWQNTEESLGARLSCAFTTQLHIVD